MISEQTKLKNDIISQFAPEEQKGLKHLEKQLIRQYVNLGKPIKKGEVTLNPSREEITKSLEGKNLLVMFGGGEG